MSENKKNLITIVIPIYNGSNCIDKCLESVVKQDYENIEILLIDDGSTDDSQDKCVEWFLKDSRIHYYSEANRGLSVAKNKGVELAKGEYVAFINSDDTVEPDYISSLYQSLYETNADISFGFMDKTDDGDTSENENLPDVITSNDAMELILENRISVSCCAKLYRTGLLRKVPFMEGIVYEDHPFIFEITGKSKRVGIAPGIIYHCGKRKDNIIRFNSADRFMDCIKTMELAEEYIRKYFIPKGYRYLERKILTWSNLEIQYRNEYIKLLNKEDKLYVENLLERTRQEIIDVLPEKEEMVFSRRLRKKLYIMRHFPKLFPLFGKD